MPEAEIAQAVQLLDLMLEHFADDRHWTRGRYDDGNGGHCLVGALLHLSRKHRLPRAPAIALLLLIQPGPDSTPDVLAPVAAAPVPGPEWSSEYRLFEQATVAIGSVDPVSKGIVLASLAEAR